MIKSNQKEQNLQAKHFDLSVQQTIDNYLDEAWELRNNSDTELFLEIVDKAQALAEDENYSVGYAASLILRSKKLLQHKELEQALEIMQKARVILDENATNVWSCRVYLGLSEIYRELIQTDKALEYAKKHLNLAESLGDTTYIAAGTQAIGIIYNRVEKHEQALPYFKEAVNLFTECNETWGIIVSLVTLSLCYRELDDYAQSEPLAQKAMDLALSINHSTGICIAHAELGNIFLKKQNYAKAQEHFHASIKVATSLKFYLMMIESYLSMAKIPDLNPYLGINHHKKQQAYVDKATALAIKFQDKNMLSDCYKVSAALYKKVGKFELALTALEEHMELKQELYEERNKQALDNALVIFETEKAQNEAELHRLKTVELQETVTKLEELNKTVKELSIRDTLTGLYNRRHLQEQLKPLFEQAIRYEKEFSICLLDIDYFKQINDNFSHQVGDNVLKTFASVLSKSCRSADVVARYGGEEFIILMPETTLESAHSLSERLRQNIENYDWSNIAPNLSVTASFGISSKQWQTSENSNPEKLIALADKQLYVAKELGRNQVSSSHTPSPT